MLPALKYLLNMGDVLFITYYRKLRLFYKKGIVVTFYDALVVEYHNMVRRSMEE
jgi:hypothetical protein